MVVTTHLGACRRWFPIPGEPMAMPSLFSDRAGRDGERFPAGSGINSRIASPEGVRNEAPPYEVSSV